MKRPKLVTSVLTVAAILLVAALVGLVVIYSGWIDVAASKPEGAITSWVLGTTMDHSVHRHAAGFSPDLSRADLNEGAEHYEAMCAVCHGAPGREPTVIAQGLNPDAPDLTEAAGDWTPGEIYWILEHGIKMSGMPAFGKTHTPEQLTNMTAFVVKMQGMTAQEYQKVTGQATTTSGPGDTSNHRD